MPVRPSLLTAAGAIAFMVSCATESGSYSFPVSSAMVNTPQSRNIADQLFVEVNQYRRGKNASPLVRHRGLDQLASRHAQYLIDKRGTFSLYGRYVSHDGFTGRSLIARESFGFQSVAENVAATTGGTNNAAKVFRNMWVGSPNHERTMRAAWIYTGVAVAVADDGTVIAVQIFGNRAMASHDAMMDKLRGF